MIWPQYMLICPIKSVFVTKHLYMYYENIYSKRRANFNFKFDYKVQLQSWVCEFFWRKVPYVYPQMCSSTPHPSQIWQFWQGFPAGRHGARFWPKRLRFFPKNVDFKVCHSFLALEQTFKNWIKYAWTSVWLFGMILSSLHCIFGREGFLPSQNVQGGARRPHQGSKHSSIEQISIYWGQTTCVRCTLC